MSIRFKILTTMLTAFLIVTVFLGTFMYGNYNDVIIKQVKSDINSTMIENKSSFDNIVKGISRGFASISYNEFIVEAITENQDSYNKNYKNRILIADEIKSIFDLVLDSYIDRYALHFYINGEYSVSQDLNYNCLEPFNNDVFGLYSTKGLENEKWFKDTVDEEKPWHVFRTQYKPEYIFFAKAIRANSYTNSKSNEFLGVGVVGIDCRQLLKNIRMRTVGEDVVVAILDSNNKVICKSSDNIENKFIIDTAKKNIVGFGTTNQIETDDYVITMAKTDAAITFVTFADKSSVYLQGKDIRNLGIIAIVIAILLATVLIYILSYYLTRPIKKLSGFMQQIDYDNLIFSRVQSKSKDEVGELYRAFNIMLDKIENSVERENEEHEKARQMEIRMLQAQINPHFLYNVLDSISWIAMENGQDRIVEMADLLSQIFAYSVKDGKIMANISEEFENVTKYLNLQKNRYSEDLTLKIDADEDCMDLSVPKCILQPLVENSIMHGMNQSGIVIKITARKKEDCLEITIDDDGNGEDMERINAILSGEDEELTKYHLGIRNVVARIKQLYGNGYGLSYEKKQCGGLIARILLPINKSNQNEKN